MLTKRKRDLIRPNAEPTPFAAGAKDLGALRNAVVDAASIGVGLWISYLFVLFYFAIAAGAVTHRDLLLENPVKLPFLNIELPLKAFFILGPLVFLVVHAYVLLHFVLFTGKISTFHLELQAQVSGDDARARRARNYRATSSYNHLPARARCELAPSAFLCGASSISASSLARWFCSNSNSSLTIASHVVAAHRCGSRPRSFVDSVAVNCPRPNRGARVGSISNGPRSSIASVKCV